MVISADTIISIGDKKVKPRIKVGEYIEPEKWDEFISNEDVVVIDTRNDFEVKLIRQLCSLKLGIL